MVTTMQRNTARITYRPAAIPARITINSLMKMENGGVPAKAKTPMSKSVPAIGAIPSKPRITRISRVP